MRLPKLSSSIWLLIGALLVVLGLWVGIVLPGLNRNAIKTQEILATQNNLDQSATTIANFINAKQAQPDLEQARTELASVFINPANPVQFISRLEELATEHNVVFDITVSEPAVSDNPALAKRPVRITMTGLLNDSLAYLNAVSAEPFALLVNTISIDATDGPTGTVTITVDGLTYWRS